MKSKEIKLKLLELALKDLYEKRKVATEILNKFQLQEGLSESLLVKNPEENEIQITESDYLAHKVGVISHNIRVLEKIKDQGNFKSKNVIETGSLVTIKNGTTKHYFFLEEGGGLVLKPDFLNDVIIIVSKNSATYFGLHNKKEGDKFYFENNLIEVLKVE